MWPRIAVLIVVSFTTRALACMSLLDCPTKIHDEPQTELARLAYSQIDASTSLEDVKLLLGRPTAVTLPTDRDPSGEFQLTDPREVALFWYENGHCGPIAIQRQSYEGKSETLVLGSTLLCLTEPGSRFPFNPPVAQRCDGGREGHEFCH